MAEADSYPSAGVAAAQVAALAASLVATAADRSREQWEDAGGSRAQAQALERRVSELAERGATAYAAAREALARPPGGDDEDQGARDWELGIAVEEAAGPPLELARAAADLAALAAVVARRGVGEVQVDAAIAAVLAAAAANAAAQLVQVNLVVGDQQPAELARQYADAAAAAAASATAFEI
jgi:formiminotetrahydrofolate cyclodeaminase